MDQNLFLLQSSVLTGGSRSHISWWPWRHSDTAGPKHGTAILHLLEGWSLPTDQPFSSEHPGEGTLYPHEHIPHSNKA